MTSSEFLRGLGYEPNETPEERRKRLIEQGDYRRNLRGSPNRHLQSEAKMLDSQHEAEQQVLLSRRNRQKPRIRKDEDDSE